MQLLTECCREATNCRHLCHCWATKDVHIGCGSQSPGFVRSLLRRAISTQSLPLRGMCGGNRQKAIRRGKVLQAAGGSAAAGWCSLANIGKGNGRQGTRRMGASAFDYCKFPSRHVTEGSSRAPRVCQTMRAPGDGRAHNADRAPVPRTLKTVKPDWDQEVVCAFAHPISAKGEGLGLACSRARDGAMVKVVGMTRLQWRGAALALGLCVGHDGPDALGRGPVAVAIHVQDGTFDLGVREAGLAMRRAAGKASPNADQSGTLGNDAGRVGPARSGAVVHAGSRVEVVGYADI